MLDLRSHRAQYRLARPGQMPAGHLVHLEDGPGPVTIVNLDSRHVRGRLVWELNWLARHRDSRHSPQASPLGADVMQWRWEIIPTHAMPSDRRVIAVEDHGVCVWLLRSDTCTTEIRDEMNDTFQRVPGDLWWPAILI